MIKGFEEETKKLTQAEYDQLPVILIGLRKKQGKRMAVKNNEIVSRLTERGYKISEARVRKIINHIRVHNLIPGLIATSDGYYISEDKKEVEDYIESLRGRENSIAAVRREMEEYLIILNKTKIA